MRRLLILLTVVILTSITVHAQNSDLSEIYHFNSIEFSKFAAKNFYEIDEVALRKNKIRYVKLSSNKIENLQHMLFTLYETDEYLYFVCPLTKEYIDKYVSTYKVNLHQWNLTWQQTNAFCRIKKSKESQKFMAQYVEKLDISRNTATKLYNSRSQISIGYDLNQKNFYVTDLFDSHTYYGRDAVQFIDSGILYIPTEKRKKQREKQKADINEVCRVWAYFSKGKGHVKDVYQCTAEGQNAFVVFSGFNKNDNVVDEVFVLPPSGGKIVTDPSIIPPKLTALEGYFQQGVSFYYLEVMDCDKKLNLDCPQNVVEFIDKMLKDREKWVNKSGVKYHYRDRWGNYLLM